MGKSNLKLLFFSKNTWRYLFIKFHNLKYFYKRLRRKVIYTRSSYIPKAFSFLNLKLFKGNLKLRLFFKKKLTGCRFGEFSFTRKPFFFIPKAKKQKLLKR